MTTNQPTDERSIDTDTDSTRILGSVALDEIDAIGRTEHAGIELPDLLDAKAEVAGRHDPGLPRRERGDRRRRLPGRDAAVRRRRRDGPGLRAARRRAGAAGARRMTRSLDDLDAIAHDALQTHIDEYLTDARGPYPNHPHGDE